MELKWLKEFQLGNENSGGTRAWCRMAATSLIHLAKRLRTPITPDPSA